jgi:predicted HD phosphohydrolase
MSEKKPVGSYTRLDQTSAEDWESIMAVDNALVAEFPAFLRRSLRQLDSYRGFPISRLEHGLQTATRAHRDNASDEEIVVALLHDIGDTLMPHNHGEVAAALLRPYLSKESYWLIRHHGVFQGFYYWDKIGEDHNAREKYRGHPCFDATANFCERWDSVSFDPAYPSLPLEFFDPLLDKFFSKPLAD